VGESPTIRMGCAQNCGYPLTIRFQLVIILWLRNHSRGKRPPRPLENQGPARMTDEQKGILFTVLIVIAALAVLVAIARKSKADGGAARLVPVQIARIVDGGSLGSAAGGGLVLIIFTVISLVKYFSAETVKADCGFAAVDRKRRLLGLFHDCRRRVHRPNVCRVPRSGAGRTAGTAPLTVI
jgi:hypothetical protein